MKIALRLSLVNLYSLFFRKFDYRYFPGDLAALRHDVVLSDCGKKFQKGTVLRLMAQYRPGIFNVFAVTDKVQDCFQVSCWSLRKLWTVEKDRVEDRMPRWSR